MRPMKKIQDWGVGYFDWVTNGGGVIHSVTTFQYEIFGISPLMRNMNNANSYIYLRLDISELD